MSVETKQDAAAVDVAMDASSPKDALPNICHNEALKYLFTLFLVNPNGYAADEKPIFANEKLYQYLLNSFESHVPHFHVPTEQKWLLDGFKDLQERHGEFKDKYGAYKAAKDVNEIITMLKTEKENEDVKLAKPRECSLQNQRILYLCILLSRRFAKNHEDVKNTFRIVAKLMMSMGGYDKDDDFMMVGSGLSKKAQEDARMIARKADEKFIRGPKETEKEGGVPRGYVFVNYFKHRVYDYIHELNNASGRLPMLQKQFLMDCYQFEQNCQRHFADQAELTKLMDEQWGLIRHCLTTTYKKEEANAVLIDFVNKLIAFEDQVLGCYHFDVKEPEPAPKEEVKDAKEEKADT